MQRKTVDELLRDRLRELGAIGGKSAAKKLSKEQRSTKAQLAARARWKKAAAKSAEVRTAKAAKKPAGKAGKPDKA